MPTIYFLFFIYFFIIFIITQKQHKIELRKKLNLHEYEIKKPTTGRNCISGTFDESNA